MNRATKIWLIIALSLTLLGIIILGGAMSMMKWDFTKLSTNKYETNIFNITDDFSSISLDTNTADIRFVPSENSECSVTCYDHIKMKYSAYVKDGALIIKLDDTRKWYEYIGINFEKPSITVSLPKAEYAALSIDESTGDIEIPSSFTFENVLISLSTGDVSFSASASEDIKIKTSTGDIRIENLSARKIDLSVTTGKLTVSDTVCEDDLSVRVSTGKVCLTNVRCKNLISSGSTGDITLTDVIASEKFSIERDTGDVKLEECDATEIFVETDTGDVIGTLLSEKVFITETDTGRVNVPSTVTGTRCEIKTDTGDIKISVIAPQS